MAKNFNSGIIKYDEQVVKFDMFALSPAKIDFPDGVMKKLEYFSDAVLYPLEGYNPETADLSTDDEKKLAQMGHIQAVAGFAGDEFAAAQLDRGVIRNEFAAADTGLDNKIIAETQRATEAEGTLQSNITAEYDRAFAAETKLATDLTAEYDRAVAAEGVLATDLAEEIERAKGIEGGLRGDVDQNSADITAENVRAVEAETKLTADLQAEVERATAAEVANANAISTEAARAFAAEGVLDGKITTEHDRAVAAETALDEKIEAEAVARAAAVLAEETRAKAAELANANAISAEELRASQAEAGLNTRIDNLISNTDEIALNSLAEIVAEFQAVDGDLSQAITNALGVHTAELEAHELDFEAHVSSSQAAREQIVADFQAADVEIKADIAAAELKHTTELAAEIQFRIEGDANLQAQLDNFAATASADFSAIEGDLAAEIARATAAEIANATAITAEQAAREAADSALRVDFGNADAALETSLKAYADQSEADAKTYADGLKSALESKHDAEMATEIAARIAGDEATLSGSKAYTDALGVFFEGEMNKETEARVAAEAAIQSDLDAYKSSNDDALAAEIIRAQNAEGTLQSNITAEEDRAKAAEQANADAIVAERVAREGAIGEEATQRQNADAGLQSSIDAMDAAYKAADVNLTNSLNTLAGELADEKSARQTADNGLQASINTVAGDLADETDRAVAAEGVLDGKITALESKHDSEMAAMDAAYKAGDAGLQAQINDILSNTDPVALDSLSEIVAAFQSADNDLNAAITAALGTHTSELNVFQGEVSASFTALESKHDSEMAAMDAAYKAADGVVLSDAKAYTDGEISTLSTFVEGEFVTLEGLVSGNTSAILDEVAARTAGDMAEAAARTAADDALQQGIDSVVANLNSEVGRATGAEATLRSDFEAKDAEIMGGKVSVEMYDSNKGSVMAAGFEYYIVEKGGSLPVGMTLPVVANDHKVTVKVAAGSAPIQFSAASGNSINGEQDGMVQLYAGASVTFVNFGGVLYMM